MTAVVHIAGPAIQVGGYLRQRCAWCGAVLLDYALACTCADVSAGEDPRPATWPDGGLVAVDGSAQYVVPHIDGADLPVGSCGLLDPAVTA
jgi:hypothetical protein